MPTQHPEYFARLVRPFADAEVYRHPSGHGLTYSPRAVEARLDDVCGPEGWSNDFRVLPARSKEGSQHNIYMCMITITLPGGGEVTKTDVGSDFGDALKRAAVKLGIGRYLNARSMVSYRVGRVVEIRKPIHPASRDGAHRLDGRPREPARRPPGQQLYHGLKKAGQLPKAVAWARQHGYPTDVMEWDWRIIAKCKKFLEESPVGRHPAQTSR